MEYKPRKGNRAFLFEVHPYSLLFYKGEFYLLCFVPGKGMRHFALEGIKKAEITKERFEIPEGFSISEFLKVPFGLFYGKPITVKVIFDYPGLRPYQLESIKKQHSEAIVGLKEDVRSLTPSKIYNASNIMNYAFFRIIGFHFQMNFLIPYNQTPFVRRGKDLAAYTVANYVNDYEGDIKMINYWSDYFNLSKWFRWVGFEDVPADYSLTH